MCKPLGEKRLRLESRLLLSKLARASRGGIIDVSGAAEALKLPRRTTTIRLSRLENQGWLIRIRRGLYLVLPVEASPGTPVTVEDPWILAAALYAPFYIGGWSAAEHWGLTEQLFRSTFVATAANVRRREDRFLNASFRIVRVAESRLKTTTLVWRGRERIPTSGPEKTIADALADPRWVGSIRHLIEILLTYKRDFKVDIAALLKHVDATKSGAAFKRLGFLTEALEFDWPEALSVAEKRRTTGLIKLDPAVGAKGKINKHWGLRVNTSVRTTERE